MTPTQDIFIWIENIIKSCTNDFHFAGVDKLIDLFNEHEKSPELTDKLKHERALKWNEIHVVIAPHLSSSPSPTKKSFFQKLKKII